MKHRNWISLPHYQRTGSHSRHVFAGSIWFHTTRWQHSCKAIIQINHLCLFLARLYLSNCLLSCMYVCLCLSVCMYVCMYACVTASVYVCVSLFLFLYVCIYGWMDLYTHIHTPILIENRHTCIYIYLHTDTHTDINRDTHAYIYRHIHTYRKTDRYTYIQTDIYTDRETQALRHTYRHIETGRVADRQTHRPKYNISFIACGWKSSQWSENICQLHRPIVWQLQLTIYHCT